MRSTFTRQLFLMSLYITVLHTVPAPVGFTISSHNFRHVLQWSAGARSPPQTVFSVNRSCNHRAPQRLRVNIKHTSVDVSDTFQDIYTSCTFTLWASADDATSARVSKTLTPYEDTIIGPPVVLLSGCGHCVNLSISVPSESRRVHELQPFYNSVSFNISWKKAGQSEVNHIFTASKQHVLQNLQPGVQYCVKVLPQINCNPNTLASAWQCEHTSEEEPGGMLYLLSWSVAVALAGLAALLLALGLVYSGSVCKPKTPLPEALGKISAAYCLVPEQTFCESVSLTEPRSISPSRNIRPLNAGETGRRQREDEENYFNKADTDDEEEDEDERTCHYRECVTDSSGWETNNSEEKAVFSVPRTFACKKQLALDAELESTESQETAADVSDNINLFSVTLRALGPDDDDDDDEEEVCKPLLPMLVGHKAEDCSLSEVSVQQRARRDRDQQTPLNTHSPVSLRSLCSSDLNMTTEPDTAGYMLTHTGHTHEEVSDCDTEYISR